MNYRVIEKDNKKYIEFAPKERQLSSEQDVLDLISICFETGVRNFILYAETFSEDFFNLRTGLAGMMLQKFINYQIKVAVVLVNEDKLSDRFKEMLLEANKGNEFRTFKNIGDAELWLLRL